MSPIYLMARSDPFDRDIRAPSPRAPRSARRAPAFPVLRLADRALSEQILLTLHYEDTAHARFRADRPSEGR